jgi:hypothetical protein
MENGELFLTTAPCDVTISLSLSVWNNAVFENQPENSVVTTTICTNKETVAQTKLYGDLPKIRDVQDTRVLKYRWWHLRNVTQIYAINLWDLMPQLTITSPYVHSSQSTPTHLPLATLCQSQVYPPSQELWILPLITKVSWWRTKFWDLVIHNKTFIRFGSCDTCTKIAKPGKSRRVKLLRMV